MQKTSGKSKATDTLSSSTFFFQSTLLLKLFLKLISNYYLNLFIIKIYRYNDLLRGKNAKSIEC